MTDPTSPKIFRDHSSPKSRKDTAMPSFSHPIAKSAPFARSAAIAALIGATVLASPLTSARADSTANAAIQLAQAATGSTETKMETVEQRITDLHAALKITPDEESKWNAVAQAMRENAANMDKVVAENRTTPPEDLTAMDQLKIYEKFSQAHVDGVKNLVPAFEQLYAAMPDAQKKIADDVFRNFGRKGVASPG
jgi:protein CpxP